MSANAPVLDPRTRIRNHGPYHTGHHVDGGGFRNEAVPDAIAGQSGLSLKAMGWMLGRAFRSLQGFDPTPVQSIDPAALSTAVPRSVGQYEAHWLGHATTLIRTADQFILTDPVFSTTIGPVNFAGVRRLTEAPIAIADLPRVDMVLISHDHYDHLDAEAVRELESRFRPWWFVPLGVGKILENLGVGRVYELDWWQYLEHGDLTLHCLPARHFSGRGLLDRDQSLWASWAITDSRSSRQRGTIYFAGDTGYGPHFKTIRQTIGPIDLAILPIGAYLPRWFMQAVHVDPAQAVQAFLDLEARSMLPIHWGTFDLADEAVHEPPRELQRVLHSRGMDPARCPVLPVGGALRHS